MPSDRQLNLQRRGGLLRQLHALCLAPLMRGTLYERLGRCGRDSCACARDPKARHRSHFLTVFLDGRTRGLHVRACDVERVRKAIAAYDRLWQIVNALTACEVADLKREARDRRRARQRRRA